MKASLSAEALAEYLSDRAIEASVIDDGFVALPLPGSDDVATLRTEGGWIVFKMLVAEIRGGPSLQALRNLNRIHDRLIGLRFSVVDEEVWVIQDFPLEILNDDFYLYIDHVFAVLENILQPLRASVDGSTELSEEEIDALFGFGAVSTH